MIYIILISGILSLFLGFVAIKSEEKNSGTIAFSFFCFITSIWIELNFLLSYFNNYKILNFIYAFGTFVSASLLSWSYYYIKNGNKAWKHLLIYSLATFIAIISIFTDLILKKVIEINISGIKIEEGLLFPLFAIFLSGSVIISLIRIFIDYKKASGLKKQKNMMILIGISGFTGISILVSSVLPMFGIFKFTNFDSPSSLIFIIFTFLAIIKYRFLKIKIILVHFFIATLIILSFLDIFFSDSLRLIVLRVFFLVGFSFVGIMLLNTMSLEIKRRNELEKANAKLLKLDKAKTEFISVASHQLRTPLTSMKGFISIMKNGVYGKFPQYLVEPMSHIEVANDRLVLLVEEMLNVSKIELGRIKFFLKMENVNEIIEEIKESFVPAAQEKKLKFNIKLKKEIPNIYIDYIKTREMLSNIVDNAIKYTPKGSVSIETNKIGNYVQVKISDTGIGISKKNIGRIFEKFARGKRAQQIKKDGSGLGLYLAKKIAEAQNIKIKVFSHGKTKGTTFTLLFPLNK